MIIVLKMNYRIHYSLGTYMEDWQRWGTKCEASLNSLYLLTFSGQSSSSFFFNDAPEGRHIVIALVRQSRNLVRASQPIPLEGFHSNFT